MRSLKQFRLQSFPKSLFVEIATLFNVSYDDVVINPVNWTNYFRLKLKLPSTRVGMPQWVNA